MLVSDKLKSVRAWYWALRSIGSDRYRRRAAVRKPESAFSCHVFPHVNKHYRQLTGSSDSLRRGEALLEDVSEFR
jgi:hypothetical protein